MKRRKFFYIDRETGKKRRVTLAEMSEYVNSYNEPGDKNYWSSDPDLIFRYESMINEADYNLIIE